MIYSGNRLQNSGLNLSPCHKSSGVFKNPGQQVTVLLCSDEEMTAGFSGFGGREAAGTLGR